MGEKKISRFEFHLRLISLCLEFIRGGDPEKFYEQVEDLADDCGFEPLLEKEEKV